MKSESESNYLDLDNEIPEENTFFIYSHANIDTIHMDNGPEKLYTMTVPPGVYLGDVTKSACSIKVLPNSIDKEWIKCIKTHGLNTFVYPELSSMVDGKDCNYSNQTGQTYQANYWQDFKLYWPNDEYFNLAIQFPLQYSVRGKQLKGEKEASGLWGIYDINGHRLDDICNIFEEEYVKGKYGLERAHHLRPAGHAGGGKTQSQIKRPHYTLPHIQQTAIFKSQVRDSPRGSLELSVFIEKFKKYTNIKGPILLFLISCRPLNTKASYVDKTNMKQQIFKIEDKGLKNVGRRDRPHTRHNVSEIDEVDGGSADPRSRRIPRKRVSKKKRKTRRKKKKKMKNKKRKTIQLKRRRRKSKKKKSKN